MPLRMWGQYIIQDDAPAESPVMVGTLWLDGATGLLKRCTSIAPYTFTTTGIGTGTVTSVAMTVPSLLSVTGSPIVDNGTLAVTWNGVANRVPYFSGSTTLATSAGLTFDGARLTVTAPTTQLRLAVDASNHVAFTVDATGFVQINASGVGQGVMFTNDVQMQGGLSVGPINGIGTAALYVTVPFPIPQAVFGWDDDNKWTATTGISGATSFNAFGVDAAFAFLDPVTVSSIAISGGMVNGGVVYSTATAMAVTAAGTAGQLLTSAGAAAPTWEDNYYKSGTGNPQGVLAAAVGTLYTDRSTGRVWAKQGGAATAYGWYPIASYGTGGALERPTWGWRYHFDNRVFNVTGSILGTSLFTQVLNSATYTTIGSGATAQPSLRISTTVSGGNVAQFTGSATTATPVFDFDFDFVIKYATHSDITGLRMWLALTSTDALAGQDNMTAAATVARHIAVRYSSVAGNTGWVGLCKNGANNVSTTAVLNTFATGAITMGLVRIRKVSGVVYFSVDDGTEVTLSSNVPSTGLTYFYFGIENTAGVQRFMYFRSATLSVGV